MWTSDGEPVRRFVTDKGRAALLRLIDQGRAEISEDEVNELTTAPDLTSLLDRMGSEAGDGA